MLKIWSWRQAIAKAKLEPTTKLVLYTLANYMNEHGQGCYPSLDTIQEESGLARATVCKHLDLSIQAGFLSKKIHGYTGQGWARNEYIASYPISLQGSSAIEPPLEKGSSIDDTKAVQPVNSISPYNTPVLIKEKIQKKKNKYTLEFEDFWKEYPPNDGSKKKAFECYEKAIKKENQNGNDITRTITDAARDYRQYLERTSADRKFTAHASTWLNQSRWETRYAELGTNTGINGNAHNQKGGFAKASRSSILDEQVNIALARIKDTAKTEGLSRGAGESDYDSQAMLPDYGDL